MSSTPNRPRLIAVIGTNASGKSELGIALAAQFNGELVSADSRQVYLGMNLAAGKATAVDLGNIHQHLVDIVAPTTRFSLADFQKLAYDTIDSILDRKHVPFLVGGTGLYVRSVVEGYQLTAVVPDLKLREKLETLSDEVLWRELDRRSPDAAKTIDYRNRRRLIRAIEIAESGHSYMTSHTNVPRYEVLQLGLTWPREILRIRIMARLRQRLAAGMVEEVAHSVRQGISHQRLEDLGLEYRYISRYLRGLYSAKELEEELGRAIYRFAVRQISWFRNDRSIVWLSTDSDYQSEAAQRVAAFLG